MISGVITDSLLVDKLFMLYGVLVINYLFYSKYLFYLFWKKSYVPEPTCYYYDENILNLFLKSYLVELFYEHCKLHFVNDYVNELFAYCVLRIGFPKVWDQS